MNIPTIQYNEQSSFIYIFPKYLLNTNYTFGASRVVVDEF